MLPAITFATFIICFFVAIIINAIVRKAVKIHEENIHHDLPMVEEGIMDEVMKPKPSVDRSKLVYPPQELSELFICEKGLVNALGNRVEFYYKP